MSLPGCAATGNALESCFLFVRMRYSFVYAAAFEWVEAASALLRSNQQSDVLASNAAVCRSMRWARKTTGNKWNGCTMGLPASVALAYQLECVVSKAVVPCMHVRTRVPWRVA